MFGGCAEFEFALDASVIDFRWQMCSQTIMYFYIFLVDGQGFVEG